MAILFFRLLNLISILFLGNLRNLWRVLVELFLFNFEYGVIHNSFQRDLLAFVEVL